MRVFLKSENLALFILAALIYFLVFHFSWWIFIIAFLAVDISQFGYLINAKIGAFIYNLFHNLILPVIIFVIGYFIDNNSFLIVALILFAHVFMDRTFGYGLKYPDKFQHTHLS